MTEAAIDVTGCDREPIHIPGSIQPHGILLIVKDCGEIITHAAGDVEGRLGMPRWQDAPLAAVIGDRLAKRVAQVFSGDAPEGLVGKLHAANGEEFDLAVRTAGPHGVLELEPADAERSEGLLARLEAAGSAFERALGLKGLCSVAAKAFRELTGYDRVMIYRFLDDGAGEVLGEDKADDQHSFMDHRFPASDIPQQARALYLRNLVRVIPNVSYSPAVVRPAWREAEPLDMSDVNLRSVSPIHVQYLKNMGVGASASMSIVKDGVLWGLVACHHDTPLRIPYEVRSACRALAGGLARQIKSREEAEGYRERIRLRGFEDTIVELLSREGTLDAAMEHHLPEVRRMLGADGVAVLRGKDVICEGKHPDAKAIHALAKWVTPRAVDAVFASDELSAHYPAAATFTTKASGLLAMTLTLDDPWVVLWFRVEEVQVIEWAGDPHSKLPGPSGVLTPRASFEAWRETVHGKSRRWTLPEIEAAARLRTAVLDVRRTRQLAELNQRLLSTIGEKDLLLRQKEFLVGEVNHRVQNSLQLVSSFLALQGRGSEDETLNRALDEARRRINAVALVHRRLYRGDQLEVVDAARYIEELTSEMIGALGSDWTEGLTLDLSPVMIPTDRAVTMGLILTELMINATKYAYGGHPGVLHIQLVEERSRFRLSLADHGVGKVQAARKEGFGSRLIDALVSQLRGEIEYADNRPGLKVTLTAPMAVS